MNTKVSELPLGKSKIIAKTGHMARQASGAVTLQLGDTLILVTVCAAKEPKVGQDFFPLTVEYQEKMYAGGVIPGGFFKREGRSTEKEILTSRLTDRPLRPLFPNGYLNEVQVIGSVLSSDGVNDPDVLCINGASLALMISEVPFLGPVGAVRVAELNGEFILNPTYDEVKESSLDLVVSGTHDGVTMIESEASEITEERMLEALKFAHEAIKKIVHFQEEFAKGITKEKITPPVSELNQELVQKISETALPAFQKINQPKTKEERDAAIKNLNQELVEKLVTDDGDVTSALVKQIVHDIEYDEVRKYCLKDRKRVDGRGLDEIRKITCELDVLPRAHGSALFTRGQTQSLGVVTLGTVRDEQTIESYAGVHSRNFMLHYNFPPFSVGETKMMRGPGRREIGHGALAQRGLKAVIPSKEEFPYTIRLVSDILESNGSSSMASICSGSLALMAAGVSTKASVSGIAMGLIKEGKDWAVLSDIAGVEDHLGDMDFKVAGTDKGITTLQLDIKLKEGLDFGILVKALEQAKAGRAHILKKMLETISSPRKELSKYAPSITTLRVNPDKISEIIGPGGRMIRKITADSGAQIEIQDDGSVKVVSRDAASAEKAMKLIRNITKDAEVGKLYDATVMRLVPFGAFCEILPGKEGLVHISELAEGYVSSVEEVVKVGDQIKVKVIEVDQQGRINLSVKQAADGNTPPRPRSRPRQEDRKGSSSQRG